MWREKERRVRSRDLVIQTCSCVKKVFATERTSLFDALHLPPVPARVAQHSLIVRCFFFFSSARATFAAGFLNKQVLKVRRQRERGSREDEDDDDSNSRKPELTV